jgi:hypothetical protein
MSKTKPEKPLKCDECGMGPCKYTRHTQSARRVRFGTCLVRKTEQ